MFLQKRYNSTEITWRDGKSEDSTGVHKLQVCYGKVLKPGDHIICILSSELKGTMKSSLIIVPLQ